MPFASFNFCLKKLVLLLFILPFLLIVFSSNFVHSKELKDFANECNKLSESLDQEMGRNIITSMPPALSIYIIRTFAASSETFANELNKKMENLWLLLTNFVKIGKKYAEFLPTEEVKHILNERAIQDFGKMFPDSSGTAVDSDGEILMEKRLKAVFDVRRKDTMPDFLTKIFGILDRLTVDTKVSSSITGEELKNSQHLPVTLKFRPKGERKKFVKRSFKLVRFVVEFLSKVRKFVRNLKKELIYAQSEGTINMMDDEFKAFTEKEIAPIKVKALNYARKHYDSLKKEIVKEYNKKLEKLQFLFKNGLIPTATIGTGVYDNLYQQQLEWKKRFSSAAGIKKGKKSKNSAAVYLSTLQKGEDVLKVLFDQLEEKYIEDAEETSIRINQSIDFLIEYHQYQYVYGMLKNCAKELNEKMEILVQQLVANGPEAIANNFEPEKMLIYALVENILKPLLKVVDGQMPQEYGQAIERQIWDNLAIPTGMMNAEITMLKSAFENWNRDSIKAIRQYRIRINAIKVLVMYERFEFFFKIFENAKNMAHVEREQKAHEWLQSNLNSVKKGEKDATSSSAAATNEPEELYILPERFGQIIFNETKKLMMTKGKA